MKITTFNPLIVTKDAENVIKLFEALALNAATVSTRTPARWTLPACA